MSVHVEIGEEDSSAMETAAPGIGTLPAFTIPRMAPTPDSAGEFCAAPGWLTIAGAAEVWSCDSANRLGNTRDKPATNKRNTGLRVIANAESSPWRGTFLGCDHKAQL